jgi:hypothetical protein
MADCAKEGNESKKAYSEHNLAMTGPVQLLRNARIVPQLEKQRSSEGGRGTHQQPNQASHAKPRKRSLATAACIIYWFPFNARHDLFYVSSWISRSGRTLFFYCFSHFVPNITKRRIHFHGYASANPQQTSAATTRLMATTILTLQH